MTDSRKIQKDIDATVVQILYKTYDILKSLNICGGKFSNKFSLYDFSQYKDKNSITKNDKGNVINATNQISEALSDFKTDTSKYDDILDDLKLSVDMGVLDSEENIDNYLKNEFFEKIQKTMYICSIHKQGRLLSMIDGIKDALNNKIFLQFEIKKDKSILTEDSNKKMQAFKEKIMKFLDDLPTFGKDSPKTSVVFLR